MYYYVGISASMLLCKYLEECKRRNPVRRITPDQQNSVPTTTHVVLRVTNNKGFNVVETRDASPAHFLTKIESFSLFSDYGTDKYQTMEFEAGDYKWRLVIYPNGHPSKLNDLVSVYLSLAETSYLPVDWEFNATFTVFLYNQILDKYLCFREKERPFNKTQCQWGFPKFMSKKVLIDQSNGYLVDNNIVLGAEVLVVKRHRVVESVILLQPTEHPQKREWKIQEFSKLEQDVWISQEFTIRDVTWKMKLYPNKDSSSKDTELSADLTCVSADTFGAHQKVKAEFCIRLKGRTGVVRSSGQLSHWFTCSNKSWEQRALISFATLRNPKEGSLDDDCCTLQVEISVQLVVV